MKSKFLTVFNMKGEKRNKKNAFPVGKAFFGNITSKSEVMH